MTQHSTARMSSAPCRRHRRWPGAWASVWLSCSALAASPDTAPFEVEVTGGSYLLHPSEPQTGALRIDVTRWMATLPAGRVGLALGIPTTADPAVPPHALAAPAAGPDVGVRWRSELEGGLRLDMLAWARPPRQTPAHDAMGMIWQSEQFSYGTRLEVQWSTSRTHGLVPEFGAVGVQLQGGSRFVLRARRGGPMVYYRTKF